MFYSNFYKICFFKAVGCALNVLGFGESIAELVGLESTWAQKIFACTAVIFLSIINVAGVKWVIKLKSLLLVVLLFAALDFIGGSFSHTDTGIVIIKLINAKYDLYCAILQLIFLFNLSMLKFKII